MPIFLVGGGVVETSDFIARSVIDDWDFAKCWAAEVRDEMIKRYSLDSVMNSIISSVKPRNVSILSGRLEAIYVDQMRFAWRYYRSWDFENWSRGELDRRELANDQLRAQNEEKKQEADEAWAACRQAEEELGKVGQELAAVYSSWSYRLGNAILRPLSLIKRLVTKHQT